MKHFKQFGSLVRELVSKLAIVDVTISDKTVYKGVAMFFLIKGWTTFQSVRLLCFREFANDAAILARSLFELTVNLLYIAKDPLKRALLFEEYNFVIRKDLFDKFATDATDPWSTRINKAIDPESFKELMKEYTRVKDIYRGKRTWSGKSLKDMAKDVNMQFQYDLVYSMLSKIAHPSPQDIARYLRHSEDAFIVGEMASREDLERVWFLACMYFLLIVDKVNEAFSVGLEGRIKDTDAAIRARSREAC